MRVLVSLVSVLAILGTLYNNNQESEVASSLGLTRNEAALMEYKVWKQQYKLSANEIEEIDFYRFYIWSENYQIVMQHNSEEGHTFSIGMNSFADLTNEEFRSQYLGKKIHPSNKKIQEVPISQKNANVNVDWVTKGATGKVLNQGQCGSCWAFSAAENLQSVEFLNNGGEFQYYSEQQLVDCSGAYQNEGCNGGEVEWAFEYVIKYGIMSAQSYPYKARDGTCKYVASQAVYPITNYTDIPTGNCDVLATAVQTQPISIAIDAGGIYFQLYVGGVFNKCGTTLDHAILLVGLVNNDDSGYWIAQNSWGTGWGQQGYVWFALGDTCGLCDQACYGNLK